MPQLTSKIERLSALLAPFSPPPLQIFPAPSLSYRMRAEFSMGHEENRLFYAMFAEGRRQKLAAFPRATPSIQNLMFPLLEALQAQEILKKRLFQVEFHASSLGEMMISLIYHRLLDEAWTAAASALAQDFNLNVIGRSRKQKIIIERDYVQERFSVAGKMYHYRQYESAFSQPNAEMCAEMLNWAVAQCGMQDHDLLELYCGNGNFTLPLSACFRRVLATEISKTSIQALQENLEANGIQNIDLARLSAEELRQALQGVRPFRRLQQAQIDLQDYDFQTIFIDPPRAGVDSETLAWLAAFPRILYVSCNPQTLAENLSVLSASHCLSAAALFDQFPDTPHIESAVVLEKRF